MSVAAFKTFVREPALRLLSLAAACFFAAGCTPEEYTRGIGKYPGLDGEYDGPRIVKDKKERRNLALNKAAVQSSSFDYNLTSQLVTDGIKASGRPRTLLVETNGETVPLRLRERLFDDNFPSIDFAGGPGANLTVSFQGGCPETDAVAFDVSPSRDSEASSAEVFIEARTPRGDWTVLSQQRRALDGNLFTVSAPYPSGAGFCAWRLRLESPGVKLWRVSQATFTLGGKKVRMVPSDSFTSVWKPATDGPEWVCINLDRKAKFNLIRLTWTSRPERGSVEVLKRGRKWKTIATIDDDSPLVEEIPVRGKGRALRINVEGGEAELSEVELIGRKGYSPEPRKPLPARGDSLPLSRGVWVLQRASEVAAGGEDISRAGFDCARWIPATVPGTVTASYYNAGAIPDIRFDDLQTCISESFFNSDFYYRGSFVVPESFEGRELTLHFDGINWKSEIYLNGTWIGNTAGAFKRNAFDVSSLINAGKRNYLCVKVLRNDNPGVVKEQNLVTADFNGGVLGADNPTFHPTIGWDWIPTVRGRNIGIWDDVFLTACDGVSVEDAFVTTELPLPSTEYASISPRVSLRNHGLTPVEGTLNVGFGPLSFSREVTVPAGETIDVCFDPSRLQDPVLWWPAGYGEPYLYDVEVRFCYGNSVASKSFKAGVRQMDYDLTDEHLDIFVNGRRLVCNGGNWGFPEINLGYRSREYDAAVGYHADMNFTMIRNWVGQTADEEFYEACDRHGVMVWQDFWLANPYDGPDPDDEEMFLDNARDLLRKTRSHPCIALYCGRNEGFPPASLDAALRHLVDSLHNGIVYIPHSATGPVSGNGPYRALPAEEYFTLERGADRLHSERGLPNVMTAQSLERTLSGEHLWPQCDAWGIHDFALESAQGCASLNEMIEEAFGKAAGYEEFCTLAQWFNYTLYRAVFESRSPLRQGLLLWMSHPCWPSMVWQTYDYFLEPTGAYFGAKKACAPVHIQWNPSRKCVEVVNNCAGDLSGLRAEIRAIGLGAEEIFRSSLDLDSSDDSTTELCTLPVESFPDPSLLRLELYQDGTLLADNFYVLAPAGDLRKLLELPPARLKVRERRYEADGRSVIELKISNRSRVPSPMVRLNLVGRATGVQILPVIYEDNYFALLPGESKTVRVSYLNRDTRGEHPDVRITQFAASCSRHGYDPCAHPRLLLPAGGEQGVRDAVARNAMVFSADSLIMAACERYFGVEPVKRELEGRRLLGVSREALKRIFYLSYGWRIHGDEACLDRAVEEMKAVCAFSDWHKEHFLDVGEMTLALAIGYDWLYDSLDEPLRKDIARAIYEKGLLPARDTSSAWFYRSDHNWNQVCNGGLVCGALAVYEDYPQEADRIIGRCLETISQPLDNGYSAEGCYAEGYSYWEYGTSYQIILVSALESALGSDLGILDGKDGFKNTSSFIKMMNTPSGQVFAYSDNGRKASFQLFQAWFAARNSDTSILYPEKRNFERLGSGDRMLPLFPIFAKELADKGLLGEDFPVPEERFYVAGGVNPIYIYRSGWESPDDSYLAVKAGRASVNHGHCDVGSFFFESEGVCWAADLGAQNYNGLETAGVDLWSRNQDSQRWTVFRIGPLSHNILAAGGTVPSVDSTAVFDRTWCSPSLKGARMDLSPLYGETLDSYVRTVTLDAGENLTVVDSLSCRAGGSVVLRWQMCTAASARVSGSGLILSCGGRERRLSCSVAGNAPVKPFVTPAGPVQPYDAENPGYLMVGFEVTPVPGSTERIEVHLDKS